MNLYEFQMWQSYYNESPFGEYRKDLQCALMTKNILAPWSKSDLPLDSFMLVKDKKELTGHELASKIQGMLRS